MKEKIKNIIKVGGEEVMFDTGKELRISTTEIEGESMLDIIAGNLMKLFSKEVDTSTEVIKVPIYYTEKEGYKILDIGAMENEFQHEIDELLREGTYTDDIREEFTD